MSDGERAAGMPLRLLLLLGALAALGPTSMDVYLPGLPALAEDFGASTATAQLTVAVFVAGLALGQLAMGPLSDSLGRRRPLLGAILVFVLATAACAAAPSMAVLLLARFVQGSAATAGMVIGRAVVRDLHAGAAGARALSRLVLVYGLGPILAPLIGAQLLLLGSWRWVLAALALAGLASFAAAALVLPETHPPARRTRLAAGATAATLLRLLQLPPFRAYALAVGCATGVVVAYVSASPFLLQGSYGVSPQLFGLLFGVNAVAVVAGSQLNARLLAVHPPSRLLLAGVLGLVAVGAALLAAVALGGPLWSVEPCLFALMGLWGLIPANAIAAAMHDHPDVAGSASALLGGAQYGVAALVAPLAGLAGAGAGVAMALTVLGLASLAAAAVWNVRTRELAAVR